MGVYFIDPKTLVDTKFLFLMEHGAVQVRKPPFEKKLRCANCTPAVMSVGYEKDVFRFYRRELNSRATCIYK